MFCKEINDISNAARIPIKITHKQNKANSMTKNANETLEMMAQTHFPGSILDQTDNYEEGKKQVR